MNNFSIEVYPVYPDFRPRDSAIARGPTSLIPKVGFLRQFAMVVLKDFTNFFKVFFLRLPTTFLILFQPFSGLIEAKY